MSASDTCLRATRVCERYVSASDTCLRAIRVCTRIARRHVSLADTYRSQISQSNTHPFTPPPLNQDRLGVLMSPRGRPTRGYTDIRSANGLVFRRPSHDRRAVPYVRGAGGGGGGGRGGGERGGEYRAGRSGAALTFIRPSRHNIPPPSAQQ